MAREKRFSEYEGDGSLCLSYRCGGKPARGWRQPVLSSEPRPVLQVLTLPQVTPRGSLALPYPQVYGLIRIFPLLEDLTLTGHGPSFKGDYLNGPRVVISSSSPALAGPLRFHTRGESTARQSLELPSGLPFRKLAFSWACGGTFGGWWRGALIPSNSSILCMPSFVRASIPGQHQELRSVSSRVRASLTQPL